MSLNRRQMLLATGAVTLALPAKFARAQSPSPILTVGSRTLDVDGRAAKVYGFSGKGRQGLLATEGDRFSGDVLNETGDPLVMHWHGQVYAPAEQDRARKDGGTLAHGARDRHDFLLTPGTHWMHSHQLTEQQLLAAPMITREKAAGEVQDVVIMLHDFAFRSPAEILSELGGANLHAGHGAAPMASPGAGHSMPGHAMPGHAMGMGGMNPMSGNNPMSGMKPHANDVKYDAYLANDRTLRDPEVVRVEKGQKIRLRIINSATATAFFIDTAALAASVVAVDGSPCEPHAGTRFPIAQGQRLDLLLTIPAAGGAFPILAQVEADKRRTGIVLASAGATVAKISDTAEKLTDFATLALDERLRAKTPLSAKRPDRTYHIMLGEEPGYRWTLNGKVHGEHTPLEARVGERIEIMFMNPTMMMHPMHLHGHHFQVIGSRAGRFSGPMRDTVIVPPHTPVVVAFDVDKPGDWNLHCHHLYHMATGMMTELRVT